MSKFLKVIVNLFLVCAILIAGAILVPPLLGVSTTVVDSASMDTNLSIGSVTYSQDVNVADIAIGDKILVESDAKVYAYVVESADAGAGNYIVTDPTNSQADPEEITLRNTALKVVLTIPFIGYVMIAMRSMEGMIIIGLVVLFIIILFILSELWKDTEDEDEEDEEEEEPIVYEQAELEKHEAVQMKEPEEENHVYSEVAAEFTMDELARSIAEIQKEKAEAEKVVMEEEQPEAVTEPEVTEVEDAIEETPVIEELVEEETVTDTFIPVPRLSKEEILEKAKASGDDPEVIEYDEFGITIIDFSEDL